MIAYASRTGTRSTLAALRAAGWRLLVSATGVLRTEGFGYALDNGAWSAFQRGQSFDELAFRRALDMLGAGADFVVVPDIVCGGEASLELSWEGRCSVSRAPRIAARTRLSALLAEAGITPCGDNPCMFGPPGGMGTNGGCRCLPRDRSVPSEVRRLVRKLVEESTPKESDHGNV